MSIVVNNKTGSVVPPSVIDRDLAKGLADIKRGRVQGPFASHEEFTASLHEEAAKLGTRKSKRPAR